MKSLADHHLLLTWLPSLVPKFSGRVHLALGFFDGVHLGHQAVIASAQKAAAADPLGGHPVVATFDPHPTSVLRPEAAPRLLASLVHKKRLLAKLGLGPPLLIPFDRELSQQSALEFMCRLRESCGGEGKIGSINVGSGWMFGSGRKGDVSFLEQLAKTWGFAVHAIDPIVCAQGEIISSTRIRAALRAGDFSLVETLLGRPYTLLGQVVIGDRLGGKIGWPTANLTVFREELPPNGVYLTRARLDDGQLLRGVGNLGVRPTVADQSTRRLEIHFFDFDDDLYGKFLEVEFGEFLRPEMKFHSIEELKAQIARDAHIARQRHGNL